jgi:hypothetical protein
MMGKDHTIFAVADGMVKFDKSATRARICIVPVEEVAEDAPKVETRKTRKYAKCVPARAAARRARARGGGAGRRAGTPFLALQRTDACVRAPLSPLATGSRRATPRSPPRR